MLVVPVWLGWLVGSTGLAKFFVSFVFVVVGGDGKINIVCRVDGVDVWVCRGCGKADG